MGINTPPVILVVDTDSKILKEFKKILGEGYTVYTTESSFHALDMVKKGTHFSAIIYNNYMPCMYGNIFFSRVRNITVATRILMASKDRSDILIKALNQGGISFFISKPIDSFMVREIVKKAVIRSEYRRKLMHERLLLKGLLDNLPYGLAFKDEEGRFTRLNQLAAIRRGLTIEECLGKTEEEIEPSFTYEELARFNQRLQREERFVEMLEVPSVYEQGKSQWFMITRLLLDRAKGEMARPSVLMELDITKQKELEIQLQQAEKLHALGTMAGGIAHDFNNLLTTMIGSLELLEELLLNDSNHSKDFKSIHIIKKLLNNALEAARKGSILTERLLSFSRRKKLSFQKIDLYQTLSQNYDLLDEALRVRYASCLQKSSARKTNQKIKLKLENHLLNSILVKTDPAQFELAIMNLCINSVDAMPQGGDIIISFSKKEITSVDTSKQDLPAGSFVVVTVQDSGVGMTSETIAHIFEPFFTTKEVGWGTGLGMAMVYGFAQQSGGNVMVQSAQGKGTKISIYLPIYEEIK